MGQMPFLSPSRLKALRQIHSTDPSHWPPETRGVACLWWLSIISIIVIPVIVNSAVMLTLQQSVVIWWCWSAERHRHHAVKSYLAAKCL